MIIYLVSLAFGLGVLFVFDGLTRTRTEKSQRRWRLGPSVFGAFGGAAVATLATGWVAAGIVGLIIGALVPRMLQGRRSDKTRAAHQEALAEVAARLRDAVRAGLGLSEALALVAKNAPDALKVQLSDLARDSRTIGLAKACEKFSGQIQDPLGDLFSRALVLADRLGSAGVTEVLDGVAEAATGIALTTREVKAKQARQRSSAKVVATVPIVLLITIRFTNPAYLAPYSTPSGQFVLLFSFLMIAIGYWAMVASGRLPNLHKGGSHP